MATLRQQCASQSNKGVRGPRFERITFFLPSEGDWRAISFYRVGLITCLSEELFPPVETQRPVRRGPNFRGKNTSPILKSPSGGVWH